MTALNQKFDAVDADTDFETVCVFPVLYMKLFVLLTVDLVSLFKACTRTWPCASLSACHMVCCDAL